MPSGIGNLVDGTPPAPGAPIACAAASLDDGGKEIALNREEFGGTRLLLADLKVAQLLLDDARDRAMARLFGVPKDQSALVAVIAVVMLGEAIHDKANKILRGPAGPSRTDAVLGMAGLNELLRGIAGPSSRGTPLLGALTAIAVVAGASGPALRSTSRAIGRSGHRVRLVLNQRYGHRTRLRTAGVRRSAGDGTGAASEQADQDQ